MTVESNLLTLNGTPILATSLPTPKTIPISDGSGQLNSFITSQSVSAVPSFLPLSDSIGSLSGWGLPTTVLAQTTDPTLTSDSSANFASGSLWLNKTTKTLWVCFSAAVGAAKWGLVSQDIGLSSIGRLQIFNGVTRASLAGKQHFLGNYLDYTNPLNLTANQVYYHRNWLSAGTVITKMECACDSITLTSSFNMGVYTESSGAPSVLVAQTGSTVLTSATDTSNFKTVPLLSSWIVPSSGYYWFAFIVNDTTNGFVLMQSIPLPVVGRLLRTQTGAGVVLPNPAVPATAAANTPVYVAAVE